MCQNGDTSSEPVRISIVQHVATLPDPREGPNAVHKLMDMIVIAVCAVIAGCDLWKDLRSIGMIVSRRVLKGREESPTRLHQ